MLLSLALSLSLSAGPDSIPPETVVHLGISLRLTHSDEMNRLRRAQLDPASPQFRQWLTPTEFGERFGQPYATYAEVGGWLEHAGLTVTRAPSRAFIEGLGTAAQVQKLLGIVLVGVEDEPVSVHRVVGKPKLPAWLSAIVVNISGLDTRVRTRHHLAIGGNARSMGPQDLRKFYGIQPLLDEGFVGQGQNTVVLSTALAPGSEVQPSHVQYFYRSVADVKTPFAQRIVPNPQGDFDRQAGAASEFELDVQMHAVSLPGADSITLEVAPASEVFTTGANDIANALFTATAVSISLGLCEPFQQQNNQLLGFDGFIALQNAVIQGTMEGQTWSAASGDDGADDCRDGQRVAADFPSDIPEMIAAGGSMLTNPPWNANNALTGYTQEATWNGGTRGGAAGGGFSIVFSRPSYQASLGLPGAGRSIPDIALMSGSPAVATVTTAVGQLDPVQGTSVASPLAAGMFALIASKAGCRLGDIHATLYELGNAQRDGGAAVFHDITTGNLSYNGVTGPVAGPGYDSATGWGSLNVAALAAAFPGCPLFVDGGLSDGGVFDAGFADAGVPTTPYTQCGYLACDGGAACTTIPDGPSACIVACTPSNSASCPTGTVCSGDTLFSTGTTGECVPGCLKDSDCALEPGTVCSACDQACVPSGTATAKVGDACSSDAVCPNGAYCAVSNTFRTGYCTYDCIPGASSTSACACPSGTQCGAIGRFATATICLLSCTTIGAPCGQAGFVCQPQDRSGNGPACLPACRLTTRNGQTFDSCVSAGSNLACDLTSGVCGGPVAPPDAGQPVVDSGVPAVVDAGHELQLRYAGDALGGPPSCGCQDVSAAPALLGAFFALVMRARRRR